jgi:lysozyme family protein
MKYDNITDWSIQNCLELFEKYNGMGYKKKGLPSPYLWSYTQFYHKGKYVKDGKYNPEAISKQPGVSAIMKELLVK